MTDKTPAPKGLTTSPEEKLVTSLGGDSATQSVNDVAERTYTPSEDMPRSAKVTPPLVQQFGPGPVGTLQRDPIGDIPGTDDEPRDLNDPNIHGVGQTPDKLSK